MIEIDSNRFTTVVVGSDTFVLDEQTGQSMRIGGAGSRIWPLLVAGMSPDEAARDVANASKITYERALADTMAFVDTLRAAGVVRESS